MSKPNGKFPEHLEGYARMIERGQRNYAAWRRNLELAKIQPAEGNPTPSWLRKILKKLLL